jgi:hypothetical protein
MIQKNAHKVEYQTAIQTMARYVLAAILLSVSLWTIQLVCKIQDIIAIIHTTLEAATSIMTSLNSVLLKIHIIA